MRAFVLQGLCTERPIQTDAREIELRCSESTHEIGGLRTWIDENL